MLTDTLQEKKAIVRDFYDTAFNQKNPEQAVARPSSASSRKRTW